MDNGIRLAKELIRIAKVIMDDIDDADGVDEKISATGYPEVDEWIKKKNGAWNEYTFKYDFPGDIYVPKFLVENGRLLIEFGKVGGYFDCSWNKLTSLSGCPKSVGIDFNCAFNKFASLEGCPEYVGGSFICAYNRLTSLSGCPTSVGGDFNCSFNKLTSLSGCPKSVGRDFICYNNKLTSLSGCPQSVGRDFYCNNNSLESLDDLPAHIGGKVVSDF